jgi:hypothetical protein
MERVFDDQYIERQRKEQQSIYTQKVHAAQVLAAQAQGHTNITQAVQPMQGGGGLMNAMGLGGIFK